jgi:hypothetical protein
MATNWQGKARVTMAKKTKLLDKPREQTIIKRSIGIFFICLSSKIHPAPPTPGVPSDAYTT